MRAGPSPDAVEGHRRDAVRGVPVLEAARAHGERADPELDVADLGRGEERAREEGDGGEDVALELLHLRAASDGAHAAGEGKSGAGAGKGGGEGARTRTGCTTATSLRDGAGW